MTKARVMGMGGIKRIINKVSCGETRQAGGVYS